MIRRIKRIKRVRLGLKSKCYVYLKKWNAKITRHFLRLLLCISVLNDTFQQFCLSLIDELKGKSLDVKVSNRPSSLSATKIIPCPYFLTPKNTTDYMLDIWYQSLIKIVRIFISITFSESDLEFPMATMNENETNPEEPAVDNGRPGPDDERLIRDGDQQVFMIGPWSRLRMNPFVPLIDRWSAKKIDQYFVPVMFHWFIVVMTIRLFSVIAFCGLRIGKAKRNLSFFRASRERRCRYGESGQAFRVHQTVI